METQNDYLFFCAYRLYLHPPGVVRLKGSSQAILNPRPTSKPASDLNVMATVSRNTICWPVGGALAENVYS